LASDPTEHLGLDAEQDDVRAVDRLAVVADHPDPVLGAEVVAALGSGMAGDDLVGRHELAAEEAGAPRLGQHPRPGSGDRAAPASGSGRASIRASRPPGASQRAASSRKAAVLSRSTWLSQKPANNPPAGSPSGSAHASRTWR